MRLRSGSVVSEARGADGDAELRGLLECVLAARKIVATAQRADLVRECHEGAHHCWLPAAVSPTACGAAAGPPWRQLEEG